MTNNKFIFVKLMHIPPRRMLYTYVISIIYKTIFPILLFSLSINGYRLFRIGLS